MDVIETDSQLEEFLQHYRTEDEVFIDAVAADQTVHRRRSGVSFVFVRTSNREALFPVRHNDADGLNPKKLLKLNTGCKKFAYDKKQILHLVPFRNVVDCSLLYWFRHNRPPRFKLGTVHPKAKNIYRPIMKLAERCQRRLDRCREIVDENRELIEKTPFQKYNGEITETLFRVERSGMFADSGQFDEVFGKDLTDPDGLAYSNYNLLTQTGRPSNAYRNVNYAALDAGQRPVFGSRFENGNLINIDYDAFHLRIVSSLMGYDAPQGSFHKHLARLYFGEEEISDEDYKEAKKFTFQFLYNPEGIPEELLQLDFFQGVKDLTEKMWGIYKDHGVIQTPKHGRQITGSNIDNFNPAKALNYTLQAGGVEIICDRLSELQDHLSGKGTTPILYLYDSVLLDHDPSDDLELREIKDIMETEDLTVDIEKGERFGNLEEIHIDG